MADINEIRGAIDIMKLIRRSVYLDQLHRIKNTPDIKVITGVRRAGKSKLLESFMDDLRLDKHNNLIYVDLTQLQFEKFKDYHQLNYFVMKHTLPGKENYVFIDEVQLCPQFELVINSLHASGNYHIFITGSNAFLLSSDLATLFTGRIFQIRVLPFSFQEFLVYFDREIDGQSLMNYVFYGGMAGSYLYENEAEKYQYLRDIFDTIIYRDIKEKYEIRRVDMLEKLTDFLLDNIGKLVSARKISGSFNSNGLRIDHKTVISYLGYLQAAFAFYPIRRYDIQGRKHLASSEKYYVVDHSFRYAKLGKRNVNFGFVYENIVALELIRRDYDIYAGVLGNMEIDFIAIKASQKFYIQVSDNITEDKTFQREITPLLSVQDAYPKILIANTHHPTYSYEGIIVLDMARWLSDQEQFIS